MTCDKLMLMVGWVALLSACATSPKAAENSARERPASSMAARPAKAPPAASTAAGEEAPPEAKLEQPAPSSEPETAADERTPEEKPTSSPRAILTASDVAFIIDYARSAPRARDEKACDAEAADEPAERAACMSKARDGFLADVLRFDKDAAGKWRLYTFKRKGSNLTEVHSMAIDFADETERTISVASKGRDNGQRQLFRGAGKILFTVPNDYSIEVDDPNLGLLVYDAKVGLVAR